jgi:alpha-beta hydrolase superfamily lysophospholipase
MNAAAEVGFLEVKRLHPGKPICVVGESIGSGPASFLCSLPQPPAKLILVVPFDKLADVAADALPFLPVRLMIFDRWNNTESLRDYHGPIEIFGAKNDEVIPVKHAAALAGNLPAAKFHIIRGGHNDWSHGGKVRFTAP